MFWVIARNVALVAILGGVVLGMGSIWAYSMPEWMAEKVTLAFAVVMGGAAIFGMLAGSGMSGSSVQIIKWFLTWTGPFLVWPVSAFLINQTPAMAVAPEGLEMEWLRAVAPVGVTLAAFLWYRFSRLQEVARDAGVFVSTAIQVVSLFFAAGTKNLTIIGTSMAAASFAWVMIPIILQLTPGRARVFQILSIIFLFAGTICLMMG
jgi:hypothetical protein